MAAPIVDPEAERAVLAACLNDHSCVAKALGKLIPDDFYDPTYRAIFACMADLDGTDWDAVSVARDLRRSIGEVASSGAIRLMVELEGSPSTGTVLGHATAVSEASNNRRLVDLLRQALAAAEIRRPSEALEILSGVERLDRAPVELKSLRTLMLNSYNVAKSPRARSTLTWGHHQLDDMTGGVHGGDVIIVAGDTNEGKSSMAISVADENISRGARVLVVTLEDGPEVFGNRFLARRAKVNAKSIRDHRINNCDHSKITKAIQNAPDAPFFLHCEDMPWERVSVLMDQAILRNQIDLVILDYIQECWCEKSYPTRQLELQAVARRFRAIMRKRHRAGIILSQLTGAEKGKPPTNANIRECKDIVNGAEQAVYLYTTLGGEKMANVDKVKNGTKGRVQLKWDPDTASYETVTAVDAAMAWADERYEDFSKSVDDIADSIGAIS
jgi:replicative DNA helicase